MSMQEKYRDAKSALTPWRKRNQKTQKSAMHKRPTIKIVELMGSRLVIHVQKTKSITYPLLSSLNSAAPKQGSHPQLRQWYLPLLCHNGGKPVQLKGVIAQEGGHDVGRAARDHDRSDSRNNSQVCDIRRPLLPATRKDKPCGMLLRCLTQMPQQKLEAFPTYL